MKIFSETKETKSSLGALEKERIYLVYKKSLNGWWHCRYEYTIRKSGVKISLSNEWSCKDEYSAVYYAVKAARLDIEKYLNEKNSKYYPQLLEDVWKKYDDRKKLHLKPINSIKDKNGDCNG